MDYWLVEITPFEPTEDPKAVQSGRQVFERTALVLEKRAPSNEQQQRCAEERYLEGELLELCYPAA